MANVSFEMIGTIKPIKSTDKFKDYEEVEYKSGWVNRTLNFNLISGDNRFGLKVKGGSYKDGSGKVYLYSVDTVDGNGNRIKGEPFTIDFKDRLTHPRLKEVANWKKFVIDFGNSERRRDLKRALNKIEDGEELSVEELKKLNLSSIEDLKEEYEKSLRMRKEFVTLWDYAEFLHKCLEAGKFEGKKFRIRGEHEYQYAENNQRFYKSFVPHGIYLVGNDVEDMATENVVLYYDSNSLMDAVEEKDRYYINGHIMVYDNSRKQEIPAEYIMSILANKNNEEEFKKNKIRAKRFVVEEDDEVRELGCVVDLIDGAQKREINEEDLTEFQQEALLLGDITMEDIIREMGGNSIYGERITENRFNKLMRGYTKGYRDTSYTSEDLIIKPLETASAFEEVDNASSKDDDDFDFDLFA